MTVLRWVALLLSVLVLQSTVIPLIAVHGVKPDLLLLVVVSTGLLLGQEQGVGMGFFAGLLQDLASGNILGINIFSKMVIGFVFGMAERKVFKQHSLLPLLSVLVATLLHNCLSLFLLFILGYTNNMMLVILNLLLPQIVYNMVFSILIHRLVYRVLVVANDTKF